MVNIKKYQEYWQAMSERIAALKGAYLIVNEAQLKDVMGNISEFPVLVATVPSANPSGRDSDNMAETNTGLIFVLKKKAASDRDAGQHIDDMVETQEVMANVKLNMISDFADCDATGHEMMQYLNMDSFHQDPEYNYLGNDGWSLSFRFETKGV